jgi:opacity protein-like surface antigen
MKIAKLLCGVALGGLLASNAMAADLLYSSPAQAVVNYGGPYVGVKGGVNWLGSDPSFTDVIGGFGAGGVASISTDTGFDVGLYGGYAFGQRWGMLSPRLEVELGYLANDVSSIAGATAAGVAVAGSPATASGEVNAFYGLTNLILDVPMAGWGFTPFFGAGVGFAKVRFDNVQNTAALGGGAAGTTFFNGEDTTFAWDVTAGLSYDISRNVTFDIAYRFLQFTSVSQLTPGAPTTSSSDSIDNHQVNVGVRVHL